MSATIYWESICLDNEPEYLSCEAPSSFMEQIEEALQKRPPCFFTFEDVEALEILAKTNRDGGGNPFQELIDAIRNRGAIHVWAEY